MQSALDILRANSAALVIMLESALDGGAPIEQSQIDALALVAQSAGCPTMLARCQQLDPAYQTPARHRVRVRRFSAARTPLADTTPDTPFTRAACRAGAKYQWDCIDESADTEQASAEVLWEYAGPDRPYVAPESQIVQRGRMISAAIARGLYDPTDDKSVNSHRVKGHFQKQHAQRASERVASGGAGKREIVTRADKVRRTVNAAARRLDIMQATIPTTADPLLLQALALVGDILRADTRKIPRPHRPHDPMPLELRRAEATGALAH